LLMRRVEPEIMRRLPVRALLLAALPSGVLAGGLWAAARGAAPLGVLAVVVPVAGLFYFVQWLDLGRPMQERLLALVRQAMGQGGAGAERRVSES